MIKKFSDFIIESKSSLKWKQVKPGWFSITLISFEDRLDDIKNNRPKREELHIDVSQSKLDKRDWIISYRHGYTLEWDKNYIDSASGVREGKRVGMKVANFFLEKDRLPSRYELSDYKFRGEGND